MYSQTTRGIKVTAAPTFLDEHSEPNQNHYVWAYQIAIENKGQEPVRLHWRNWRITNGQGEIQEISGPFNFQDESTFVADARDCGLEGALIEPGKGLSYASGMPLDTPSGFMQGSYFVETDKGEGFEVDIPAFSLDSPFENTSVH